MKKLLPHQRKDFIGIFKAMDGMPVTIRLLDPPLHEFLPHDAKRKRETAKELGILGRRSQAACRPAARNEPDARPSRLPPGGHVSRNPEMQVTAITEAAIACKQKKIDAQAEIMIPLVGTAKEFSSLGSLGRKRWPTCRKEKKFKGKLDISVGTMIEVPRAALAADEIAERRRLLQLRHERPDANDVWLQPRRHQYVLADYLKQEHLPRDPFQTLDASWRRPARRYGGEKGRQTRTRASRCGICGEHGGDPDSIVFCHKVGLDYVSCCPFRVPIARLAAAQAAITK